MQLCLFNILPVDPLRLEKQPVTATVPEGECIYFLFFKGRIVYVGGTTDLRNRLYWHKWDGKEFDGYAVVQCSLQYEASYIQVIRPRYNKHFTV